MKNKIFDRKLYLESLRRTSVIGGLFTVLLTVASLLVFISHSTRPNYYLISSSGLHTAVYMDFLELNPYMLLIPFTLTPLLCLNLFGFLNKRNSSDFWHSAPFTRSCIYNTFSLVNLTWSAIAAIVPLAISALCFAFIPDQYVIAWNSALPVMLSLLAAVLLVLAAGNIAMSLTGTYFSNVVLASLILFLPRLFIMFFANMATSSPLIIFNIENTVFSPYYNIVAGAVFGFGRFIETIKSYTSICYTAVLAAIYYALGMWLFARRKSESAGHSTTSRHMQSIIRIVVCLVACLFPIYLATDYINSAAYNSETHFSDWFTVLVLYVVAIAAYFIYELIATRKVKNLVKAIPGLLIVAAINVVVIGSAHLI
ncbi:MAG: hypothetical protein IIW23_03215, partial [Clostridia bacterium]|nr:hypothetical protein [Clostridia bacterium]